MVAYYENSRGEKIDFLEPPFYTFEADWFDADWSESDSGYEKTVSIDVFGDRTEFQKNMEHLYSVIAIDAELGVYGRLYVNGTFLRCNVKSSKKSGWKGYVYATVDLTFYAPKLEWLEEITRQFYPQISTRNMTGLNFPFDFPFDFAGEKTGTAKWQIDHIIPSEFLMIVYGPCDNPKIVINEWGYEVKAELLAGEYLVIDSLEGTVTRYKKDGTTENLFNERGYEQSVFERLPAGLLQINWSGAFGFDIIVYLKRREAKW